MFLRLIVALLEFSPALRRLLWRWWYGRLARKFAQRTWTFMNYGFVPPDPAAPPLALTPADEPDRFCIQLYERVAAPVPLADATVLEVGSGRGGGASWIARRHRPRQITGVDFSPQAVALCRRIHAGVPNLSFQTGDAENLPFPDASFDAVLNVESSHCYGHVDRFFAEVARVLRPGGHFLYTDFRGTADMEKLTALLAARPDWSAVEQEDVTAGVLAALAADDDRKRRLIAELCPPRIRPLFEEFAGLSGGQMFEGFRRREVLYHRFVFRKH